VSTSPLSDEVSLQGTRAVPRPAEGVWPGLQNPGENKLRMRVARGLLRAAVRRMPMRLIWPDGTVEGAGAPNSPAIRLIRPEACFTRLGCHGLIGFGEGWMVGDWHSDDLVGVLQCFSENIEELVPRPLRRMRGFYDRGQPSEEDARDAAVSQENVHRHYDLVRGADRRGRAARRVPHHGPEPQARRHPRHGRRARRITRPRDRHRLG
jgi:cyclopropane-fatty-acyl-phospholipid synthase